MMQNRVEKFVDAVCGDIGLFVREENAKYNEQYEKSVGS
jgi:hypothetical protein